MELSRARNSIFFHEPPEISIFSSTYRIRTSLIVPFNFAVTPGSHNNADFDTSIVGAFDDCWTGYSYIYRHSRKFGLMLHESGHKLTCYLPEAEPDVITRIFEGEFEEEEEAIASAFQDML